MSADSASPPPDQQPKPAPGWQSGPPPSGPQSGWQSRPPPAGWQTGAPSDPSPYASQTTTPDERTWAMLAHLSGLIAAFFFLGFLGPLVVMLIQGDKSQFVRRHAVEALNFQITLLLLSVAAVLGVVLTLGIGAIIIVPLAGLVAIAALVLIVVAMVKANSGEDYRYPFSLRLVS